MNILILEDETPAYKKLVNYLKSFLGEGFEHEHAKSIQEGVALLSKSKKYDLILSDIRLNDGIVFDIFDQVPITSPIIFCTAFDEHLLKAFQTNGIAYILKPYSKEDLHKAMKKFENLFQSKNYDKELFKQLKTIIKEEEKSYKKRFAVKKKEGIKLINTADICLIEAYGDLCRLRDNNNQLHTISYNIGTLIQELNPAHFFRINRSQIVNVEYIEKIEPYFKNRLSIKITGLKKFMTTSSSNTKEFRKWIDQ